MFSSTRIRLGVPPYDRTLPASEWSIDFWASGIPRKVNLSASPAEGFYLLTSLEVLELPCVRRPYYQWRTYIASMKHCTQCKVQEWFTSRDPSRWGSLLALVRQELGKLDSPLGPCDITRCYCSCKFSSLGNPESPLESLSGFLRFALPTLSEIYSSDFSKETNEVN